MDDREWLALFSHSTPLSRFDPAEVEAQVRPQMANLVYNNSRTLNFQRFLYLVSQHLPRAAEHRTRVGRSDAGPIAAANAVHLARLVIKDLMEQLNSTQLLSFVELPGEGRGGASSPAGAAAPRAAAGAPRPAAAPAAAPVPGVVLLAGAAAEAEAEDGGQEAGEDLRAGGGLAAEMPDLHGGSLVVTLARAALQLEAVQLLLVLCSSQLYSPSPRAQLGQHPFLEVLMQQRDLANHVVEALLQLFVAGPAVPLSLKIYVPTDTRAVLRVVRSAAASVLWLPYQAVSFLIRARSSGGDADADSPLGGDATLLLLVLAFHAPPQDAPFGNPFRQSLARLQDADDLGNVDAAEGGRGSGSGDAAVSYAGLYDALGRSLLGQVGLCLVSLQGRGQERAVLLLYALLHGCPHFHEYCLSVPFYRERSVMRTTLGSLLVVLLLRTAHYNLAKARRYHACSTHLKDVYLHTNTLAALANLAPHMQARAALRGVGVECVDGWALADGAAASPSSATAAAATPPALQGLAALAADSTSLGGEAAATPRTPHTPASAAAEAVDAADARGAPAGGGGGRAEDAAAVEQRALELQLYADFLRIVLEIINSILTSALPANPELVYTLLHRQEVFAPFRHHPRYAELMENVQASGEDTVTDFFNRTVEEGLAVAGADTSAEAVLALIRGRCRGWRRDRLRPLPELRFTYEEEANPEEFFVPYVWSLAVAQAGVPWALGAITLFHPSLEHPPSSSEQEGGDLLPQASTLGDDLAPQAA
eukprot:scaffold12.g7913.t1